MGDKIIISSRCFKCGDSVTVALWDNNTRRYACFYCGTCGCEWGRVGDGSWHNLGVPSLYWRNYLYAVPVPDSHALKLSRRG